MSNVLIGIIGVILFIGLALAGALILGSDFTAASSSSQASAAISQVQQIQAATEMWRLKTGRRNVPHGTTTFLQPRFLKTAFNPTSAGRANTGYLYVPHFNNDIWNDQTDEGGTVASYIMFVIGAITDQKARDTCQAVADQFNAGVIQTTTTGTPPGIVGCTSNGTTYVVWGRISA